MHVAICVHGLKKKSFHFVKKYVVTSPNKSEVRKAKLIPLHGTLIYYRGVILQIA